MPDRLSEDLEALLVLDAAPGDDKRLAVVDRNRRWRIPLADVDSVRHQIDLLRRQLEPVGDLANHEPRTGDDLMRLERQPPLHGVDGGRRALRDVATVAAPLGPVDGRNER